MTTATEKRVETIPSKTTLDLRGPLALAGVEAPAGVRFHPAAGAADVCKVEIQVIGNEGQGLPGSYILDVILSDASTGVGLTGTTASGAVTTTVGTVLSTYTAKKALRIQTAAGGTAVLSITDTAHTGFYVAATNPLTGAMAVSDQLIVANYG